MKKFTFLVLVTLVFCLVAQAEDQVAFTENGDRVILHDDGTWEHASEEMEEQPEIHQRAPQNQFGAWTVERIEDTISGQTETYYWVESPDQVRNFAGRKVHPRLVLRCSGKKLDLFIAFGETSEAGTGEDAQVFFDFGGDRKTGRYLRRSVDDQALFFAKAKKDLPLFMENNHVAVRFDLFRQKGIVITFSLDGLSAALKSTSMKCKTPR